MLSEEEFYERMNEHIINYIIRYEQMFCPGPTEYYHRNHKFEVETYQKWAIDELLRYIYEHLDQNVIDSMYAFKQMMGELSCRAKTIDGSFMMSTAEDMTQTIIDEVYKDVIRIDY